MKKFLLLLLLASPLCSLAQWPFELNHPRFTADTVRTNQNRYGRIQFLQFLPPDYNASATVKHPLIIFLHGQGEIDKGTGARSEVNELVKTGLPYYLNLDTTSMRFGPHSFVVLVPQKHDSLINVPGIDFPVQAQFPAYYVDAMLKYARDENLNVDFSRVYLTGLSLGAGLVYDYPAFSDANAQKIAAIVPVSGSPVLGYESRNPPNDLCNISENKLGSRAYVGSDDIDRDRFGVITNHRPDTAAKARDTINNCGAAGQKTSELLLAPGGHNKTYWDTVYKPSYGINRTPPQPGLNMYLFMLQHVSLAESTLPVKLKYFKGRSLNAQNILEWATTLELNSDRIELLRSTDGEVFTQIASFKTNGNSSSDKEYNYRDISAPKGTSYYRLKQVDKDGKSELSRVVALENKNQPYVVERYPNPVTDRLNISIDGSIFGTVEFQILDLKGNLVKKMVVRKDQQNWKGYMDLSELSKGMYMFRMTSSDGKSEVSSFIKN